MNRGKIPSEHLSRGRLLAALVGALGGFVLGAFLVGTTGTPPHNGALLVAVMVIYGAIIFYLVIPVITHAAERLTKYLQDTPPQQTLLAGLGATGGLALAALAGWQLVSLPGGSMVTFAGAVILAWLGGRLGNSWGRQIALGAPKAIQSQRWVSILDSSVAIDDRLADVARTGILGEALVVTTAVTKELQRMADMGDADKVLKGRKGLDALAKLRTEPGMAIIFRETIAAVGEVDDFLLRLAREMNAPLVTTDFTLSQRAHAEGLRVININEIAIALRPKLLPEEEIMLTIAKKGKSEGQGVGYLEDGTMVVVNDGVGQIGNQVKVTITSVLQSISGRTVFARFDASKNVRRGR